MTARELTGSTARALERRITERRATVGVIGLGYVGLPLAVGFAQAGFPVVGFETDRTRAASLARGVSYVEDVPDGALGPLVLRGRLTSTREFGALAATDVAVICVQTPVTVAHEPDLAFVASALRAVARGLHAGQLVVLQSTTYPGTTEEIALPALTQSGLRVGEDFFLAFSPERIDPGNRRHTTRTIPRVVGGITPVCTALTQRLFEQLETPVYRVSSARAAEMTKLLENVFRSVNIALVNEFARLCEPLSIDIWEVVGAAATKPFGFMPFDPGPGVGGHCIAVDPYHLAWKAAACGVPARLTALAAEINEAMPSYVADRVTQAVATHRRAPIAGARILGLGASYKGDVGDTRESPAVKVLSLLKQRGALIAYHDAHVPRVWIDGTEYTSVALTPSEIGGADCVVVLTAHGDIDYRQVAEHAQLVFDTRHAVPPGAPSHGTILRL